MHIFKKSNMEKIWDFIQKIWKSLITFLKDIKFLKWTGLVFIVIALMGIISDTIFYSLVLWDKNKFGEIINYFYNLNIFNYISSYDFYTIYTGALLMDIASGVLFLLLGLFWFKNKNYYTIHCKSFDNVKLWIILVFLFVAGTFIFSFGIYNSMPDIMTPMNKIYTIDKQKDLMESQAKRVKEWKENGWNMKRVDFDNGFMERGYHNDKNSERRYWEYVNSNF